MKQKRSLWQVRACQGVYNLSVCKSSVSVARRMITTPWPDPRQPELSQQWQWINQDQKMYVAYVAPCRK